jgi:hypothetical protein
VEDAGEPAGEFAQGGVVFGAADALGVCPSGARTPGDAPGAAKAWAMSASVSRLVLMNRAARPEPTSDACAVRTLGPERPRSRTWDRALVTDPAAHFAAWDRLANAWRSSAVSRTTAGQSACDGGL